MLINQNFQTRYCKKKKTAFQYIELQKRGDTFFTN